MHNWGHSNPTCFLIKHPFHKGCEHRGRTRAAKEKVVHKDAQLRTPIRHYSLGYIKENFVAENLAD